MEYYDFTIQITADGDGYTARVVASLDGEASASFRPPLTEEELDRFFASSRGIDRELVTDLHDRAPGGATDAPAEVGERLFDALFHGPIRSRFDRSWAKVERDRGQGLRIKIKLDTDDPRSLALARLPWELLTCRAHGRFLSLGRRTPVVRYLDLPGPPCAGTLHGPFRILVVGAAPRRSVPLDLEGEMERLRTSCPEDRLSLTFLCDATVGALRSTLLEASDRLTPYHALHFMGHGSYDRSTGEVYLLFEDGSGGSVRVTGAELATHLSDLADLRFVLLNACRSGEAPPAGGHFAGVAASLVRAGVPAVVAMQRPVRDDEAIELTSELYARLAQGDPVDAALTEARIHLFGRDPSGRSWATPVLFMRTPDGKLFELPGGSGEATWSLDELSSRAGVEYPPLLDHSGSGGERCVLVARTGADLVIGRCHTRQLRPAALRRLRKSGEERVHWVTRWNDVRLPQLSLRLSWSGFDGGSIVVENLTDYSRRALALVPVLGGVAGEPIAPGRRRRVPAPIPGRRDLVLRTEDAPDRFGLCLTAHRGPAGLPIFRTRGLTFCDRPGEPEAATVRFLGFWLPRETADLHGWLERSGSALDLPISDEISGASVRLALVRGCPSLTLDPSEPEAARSHPYGSAASARTDSIESDRSREEPRHDETLARRPHRGAERSAGAVQETRLEADRGAHRRGAGDR